MKTFNLYERPDGRIVINAEEEPKSRLLRTIEAINWKSARKKVGNEEFFNDPGHGWFETPRPGAYIRQREYFDRKGREALRLIKLTTDVPNGVSGRKNGRPLETV